MQALHPGPGGRLEALTLGSRPDATLSGSSVGKSLSGCLGEREHVQRALLGCARHWLAACPCLPES